VYAKGFDTQDRSTRGVVNRLPETNLSILAQPRSAKPDDLSKLALERLIGFPVMLVIPNYDPNTEDCHGPSETRGQNPEINRKSAIP